MTSFEWETLWRASRKLRAQRNLGARRRFGKAWPSLLFFTDPVRTPDPAAIMAQLPRGTGVVYRAFGAKTALAEGRRLISLARRRGLLFFVGADSGLAAALGADGLHLPERDSARKGRNHRLKARFYLSAAVHDEPALRRAQAAGVDALVISPIFPSESPSAGRPKGPRAFARLTRLSRAPVYALGGVNSSTIRLLSPSRAIGVAAIGAFGEAKSPLKPSKIRT